MKLVAFILPLLFLFALAPSALAEVSTGGFTVKSIDLSESITPSTNERDVFWLIDIVFNKGGQSIAGTISTGDFSRESGVLAENSFQISGDYTETINYPILTSDSSTLFRWDVIATPVSPSDPWYSAPEPPPACPSATDLEIGVRKGSGNLIGRICLDKASVGRESRIGSPTINVEMELIAEVAGDTESATISSQDIRVSGKDFNFNDPKIDATWVGNSVTGNSPENEASYRAIIREGSSVWRVEFNSKVNNYKTSLLLLDDTLNRYREEQVRLENDATGCTYRDGRDNAVFTNCIGDFVESKTTSNDNLVEDLLDGGQTLANDRTASDSDKLFKGVPSARIYYPEVVMRVRGDWIGIVIPFGEPDITNVEMIPSEIDVGEEANVVVSVKNVGSDTDSFTTRLLSCEGFEQRFTAQPESINAGQTKNLELRIVSNDDNSDESSNCRVEVCAVNSDECDSGSFTAKKNAISSCDAGTQFVVGQNICECNQDGEIPPADECTKCEFGTDRDANGNLICRDPPSCEAGEHFNPTTLECDSCPVGQHTEREFFNLLGAEQCVDDEGIEGVTKVKVTIAVIVGIISTFAAAALIRQFSEAPAPLILVGSLVIGGAMGYLVWLTFWLLILAGILWITALRFLRR